MIELVAKDFFISFPEREKHENITRHDTLLKSSFVHG